MLAMTYDATCYQIITCLHFQAIFALLQILYRPGSYRNTDQPVQYLPLNKIESRAFLLPAGGRIFPHFAGLHRSFEWDDRMFTKDGSCLFTRGVYATVFHGSFHELFTVSSKFALCDYFL